MSICNHCGNQVPDREFQCSKCGTVLFQLNCAKCAEVLDLTYPQCRACGTGYSLPYGNPYIRQDNHNAYKQNVSSSTSSFREKHITSSADIKAVAVGVSRYVKKQFQEKIEPSVQNMSQKAYDKFETIRNENGREEQNGNTLGAFLNRKVGRFPMWIVLVGVVLLLIIGFSTINGGSSKYSKQEALLRKFEAGINNGDINKLINCFDPSYGQYIRSLLSIYTDGDVNSLMNMLVQSLGMNVDLQGTNLRISCKAENCVLNGDSGTMRVHTELYLNGKKSIENDSEVAIMKTNNNWYFSGF